MPNKQGGRKYKKNKSKQQSTKFICKTEDDEEYGQITKVKGSGRFDVMCCDGVSRMGIVRGNLRKRVWMNIYDMVLLAKWEFDDNKCSIIHKYDDASVQKLKEMKHIPVNFQIKEESLFDDVSSNNPMLPEDTESESDSDPDSDSDDIDLDSI